MSPRTRKVTVSREAPTIAAATAGQGSGSGTPGGREVGDRPRPGPPGHQRQHANATPDAAGRGEACRCSSAGEGDWPDLRAVPLRLALAFHFSSAPQAYAGRRVAGSARGRAREPRRGAARIPYPFDSTTPSDQPHSRTRMHMCRHLLSNSTGATAPAGPPACPAQAEARRRIPHPYGLTTGQISPTPERACT